jgi:protein phosphatase
MTQPEPVKQIDLPAFCLVVMMGASGAGKSTFTRRHFLPTEVLSSDYFRALVSDDESNQAATNDAFEVLYFVATKRLAARKLTVIDATNVRPNDRKGFIQLAGQFYCPAAALVLDVPEQLCHDRNQSRPGRDFGPEVVRNQMTLLQKNVHQLKEEGFGYVHIFSTVGEIESVRICRTLA